MTRLYELSKEYQFLRHELVDEETGEVNETSLMRLTDVKDNAENKCINVVRVLKDMEAEQEAVEKEYKRLYARKKSIDNQMQRLKDYLLTNMEMCEIRKISCPQFSISIRKNPDSVEIYNENEISKLYHRIKVDYDNSKIKEDLKNGIAVPGARLTNTNSVIIR